MSKRMTSGFIENGPPLSDVDDFIVRLHGEGASIIDTMKAVRQVFGIDLATAKHLVAHHPLWEEVHRAHAQWHADLLDALEWEAAKQPPDG